eukprot:TRINITY_DN26938_c0_g1_i2.p1 TRINITY_DN26938_c0_g1~~TRINITY_DN26938_c0_g1_i2.p1  ORF type:complete len:104 (-),score=23.77 TRINITY_DN26938_c0_g1_i2:99-410(-)
METHDDGQSDELLQHLAHANSAYNQAKLITKHSKEAFGSDHMSFLKKGIPAVLLIMDDDEGYPHYHKTTDTKDQVNATFALQIAKIGMAAVLRTSGIEGSGSD